MTARATTIIHLQRDTIMNIVYINTISKTVLYILILSLKQHCIFGCIAAIAHREWTKYRHDIYVLSLSLETYHEQKCFLGDIHEKKCTIIIFTKDSI